MFRSILLSSATFLICLIASEQIVKLMKLAPGVYSLGANQEESSFMLSENSVLGYELKPNFRVDKPNFHKSFPYTNSDGQRDKERKVNKFKGKSRILLLGDSVVAGHGIREEENLISSKLEQSLSDTEVLNFGVGGYCTKAEVELLKVKGLKYKPDIVFIIFVENDHVDSNGFIVRELGYHRANWVKKAYLNSHLFRLVSIKLDLFNFAKELEHHDRFAENLQYIGDNNVSQGLKELENLKSENDFKVVIGIWPYFSDKSIYFPKKMVKDKNTLFIEELASKYGFNTYRLDSYFKNDLSEIKQKLDGRNLSPKWSYTIGDGTHPNVRGASIAAKALMEIIKKES